MSQQPIVQQTLEQPAVVVVQQPVQQQSQPVVKRILNDWKISTKCHAMYYGQVVVVPCPGDQKVIRGKPS